MLNCRKQFVHVRILAGALVSFLLPQPAAGQSTPDKQPAPFRSIMQDLRDREYVPIRDNVLKTLLLLDEAKLQFRPVPAVRTLREELEHIAAVNNRLCGIAQMRMDDTRPPAPPARDTTVRRSLSELQSFVRASLDLCDRALNRIDDARALEPTTGPYLRYSHLQAMVTHLGHEYGKITVSLRLVGLVPPSSTQ